MRGKGAKRVLRLAPFFVRICGCGEKLQTTILPHCSGEKHATAAISARIAVPRAVTVKNILSK
ncbi:hypothetical protein [Paenibacillus sp. Soil750]|uniref:hypothetical protein n=1 Tax=Paenibacillus sp. Soil750 TaxID=1736398 RepID=UPI000ADDB777|nr:hypothetical protein [Paenibacillus sp. Soil750]